MRSDIYHVIRAPKGGRTWKKKNPRAPQVALASDGEVCSDKPPSIEIKHQKHRSHNTNPLKRFLVRRVGRPWNKVYAEVCERADARSFLGAEVRNDLKDFVETECWMDRRKVMSYDCRGAPQAVRGLYVHPKSGLLMRAK
jgi:hypothetical protein